MVLATVNTRVGTSVEASFALTVVIFSTQISRDAFFGQVPAHAPMHGEITKASGMQLTVKWLYRDGRSVVRQHPPEALTLTQSPVEAVVKGAGSQSAVGNNRQHHSASSKVIHFVYTMADAKKSRRRSGAKRRPRTQGPSAVCAVPRRPLCTANRAAWGSGLGCAVLGQRMIASAWPGIARRWRLPANNKPC